MSKTLLVSTKGTTTPFSLEEMRVTEEQRVAIKQRIESANKLAEKSLTDITPIYWEAEEGEQKTLVFLGYKMTVKEEDGVKTPYPVCVFHDGLREIIMAQVVIRDSMKNASLGDTFIIKCTRVTKGKTKQFAVKQAFV